MNILRNRLFHNEAVEKYSEERRPHIYEIQSVEAMGNYKHISCEDGCVFLRFANVYYEGSEAEWSAITIDSDNATLTAATKHYAGEWEYVDGVPQAKA